MDNCMNENFLGKQVASISRIFQWTKNNHLANFSIHSFTRLTVPISHSDWLSGLIICHYLLSPIFRYQSYTHFVLHLLIFLHLLPFIVSVYSENCRGKMLISHGFLMASSITITSNASWIYYSNRKSILITVRLTLFSFIHDSASQTGQQLADQNAWLQTLRGSFFTLENIHSQIFSIHVDTI